jgi:glycosyltransferase involved in cell wall biosynthesis
MKVALVHDWFSASGGAEKVVRQIIEIFPQAEIFSTVDYLSDKQRDDILLGKIVKTTFIQSLPFSKSYQKYFPLMPLAMSSLDLSGYDLVISSSASVAKGVITGPDQVHICYCHSPMRYAWDLQEDYLRSTGNHVGFKTYIIRALLHKMRSWDVTSSFGVDYFIANSSYIKRRIEKVYRRQSDVIYPPVNVYDFDFVDVKEDYYFTCSRLVPYKKIDLIVSSFSKMPDKKLIVIGDGPEMKKIKSLATDNIQLLGYQSFDVLKDYMSKAKAFVFAAEEDFGIVPVEAQACGTPVIAYGKGGALETVIHGVTGIHFREQSVDCLIGAVNDFEKVVFNKQAIRDHALIFSPENFNERLKSFVDEKTKELLS